MDMELTIPQKILRSLQRLRSDMEDLRLEAEEYQKQRNAALAAGDEYQARRNQHLVEFKEDLRARYQQQFDDYVDILGDRLTDEELASVGAQRPPTGAERKL